MVVTKTKKKVTKVTKHKVTNNKTKKRNKNKEGGASTRPQSAPASGRRKSEENIKITSKNAKPTSSSRAKREQNSQRQFNTSTDDFDVKYRNNNIQTPRPSSASKRQQTPPTPIDKTINVSAFNEKYYNAISTINSELLKPRIKGGSTIPDIINNMFKISKLGQAGGSEYSDNIETLLASAAGTDEPFTSQLLRYQKFDEPNPREHAIPMKYDVVIVGCSPEALYMSILLKLLMPGLKIVVLECGENAQTPNADEEATSEGPGPTSGEYQSARTQDNLRALTDETMMSLSYIWSIKQMNPKFETILNGIMCPPSSGSSTRGYELLNNIYYSHGALILLNIFPSCFYTEVDNREHASIFDPKKFETAKIQVNILEFFLTRRAIELKIVILHNVTIDELPNYVGANTLAIFNATGFFDMEKQENENNQQTYYCNHGIGKPNFVIDFKNTSGTREFNLKNKYGYYIATSNKGLKDIWNNQAGYTIVKPCYNRYESINPSPLKWYEENQLHVPIISIGQSLRGKIIFEWNYLGFADCFIYGLLFKRIYDETAPATVQAEAAPPPPIAAASVNLADEDIDFEKNTSLINIAMSKLLAARVAAKVQETARAKLVAEEAARAKLAAEEAARAKLAAEEAARDKLAAEQAARDKLAAEEAARAKLAAEEAARAKLAAEEAARAKLAVEEAARIQAELEAHAAKLAAEEAARAKLAAEEAARAKLAAEEVARVKLAAEEAARANLAAEEAARAKLAAEDAAKAKLAVEEAARAKLAAEEAARAKLAAEEIAKAKLAAEEATRAKLVAEETNKFLQAAKEAAIAKLAEEEAARAKLAEEEAARAKLQVELEAEEAARLKALAEEKEAARLQAELEAKEAARLQAELEAKEAARLQAEIEAKEAARLQAEAAAEIRDPEPVITNAEPTTVEQVNATPTDTLEIALGTDAPTAEDETLDITIQEVADGEAVSAQQTATAETPVNPSDTLEISLGTDAPTVDGDTLEITIEDAPNKEEEKEEEKENKENNVAETQTPQNNNLEIVLGTDAPTVDGETLEITIEEGEGEGEEETQSNKYLESVAEGARGVLNFVSDKTSAAISGTLSGAVAAAKGAADTAAKCTTDRAADATRKALEYQAPIKTPEELQKELEVDAKLEELKNQIKDNVADAGELFVDNAKKMANTVATYVNPFNKSVASHATNNLLMSQNINPPVKYLNISINPGIEFNPKMLNKNTSNADVHFNPLIKYSERVINDVPVGQPKTEIYEKFFNNNSFNIMLANTLRGLFGQTPKTIDEATDAGIVDDNIVSTLNTLFATGNVIYINNSPYTIYTYSWNGEWFIDSKIPRNLDYITGTSSSSYVRDQEQIQRYRESQNAAAQKELKQKGIGEKYRMSSILRERLMEDAKQREALQKDIDAKTAAKNAEDAAANAKLTGKLNDRTNRDNGIRAKLQNNIANIFTGVIPGLNQELAKAALNAIVSHKQFIRATQEERDIEIDPLTISLFYPTDDLLQQMLDKTKLTQDYAVIIDTHKALIKNIEEYDATEMEMYEKKTKMDNMYGKLNFNGDNKRKEEIIKELLQGKNLPYAITTDVLVAQTFAHVDKLFDALRNNNSQAMPPAIGGGFNPFTRNKVSTEPPVQEPPKIKTTNEVIDSVPVVLEASDNSTSKKETASLIEIIKYLSKQIITTLNKDINDLLTTVRQFKETLEKMVELTNIQYKTQRKYYEQYITFLKKLEKASATEKQKQNDLFLMCIRQDQISYDKMLKILIEFKMDNMQIPETIDATNYYNNKSLMDIDREFFTTFIAEILEKRYSVSNQLWEISFQSALDTHTEFKRLDENYNLKKYNELFKPAQQPAPDPQYHCMFDSPEDCGAPLLNRYAEYKEYKQQRDNLEVTKDEPNKSSPLIAATANTLFKETQKDFKRIYDEYDSREAREKRFKIMFIDVALSEIATLRKITFLTQSIHAADIKIYKCILNEDLFKKHKENCEKTPAVNSAFFNVTCDQAGLVGLLTTNNTEKTVAAQQKQDSTGQLTLLSDNQNDMFAELFPIDNNQKLEKMCNQATTDVTTLFEVTTFKQFMEGNGWSNSCVIKELNDEFITKAFKLSMLNEMFTHVSKSKPVPQSVYQNTNYWDLFCLARELNKLDKLLDAVSMILNAEMHLTSSTIDNDYAPNGKFDLKRVARIKYLLNGKDENDQLAILYQIFKIKFTIIEINVEPQPPNVTLSIIGCTNKIAATTKSNDEDEEYFLPDAVKQIEQEEKRTTFAFIIKCNDNYYIPYNSKIGTLLCSVKHLKSVGLNILLWRNCSTESQAKRKYAPPLWINMYASINQKGGASEDVQQIASIADENLKDLDKNKNLGKTIEEKTKENTQINAGVPLKSILKKSSDQANKPDPPAATADTLNYTDKYRMSQTYSRDSKLSYYVAVDLVMVPGTSISLAQKVKLKCQMKSDNIRKSLSEIFGTIYVPTPIFITTSEEYAKSKTEDERNRIIQYQTVSDLVNEKKMNNLKGVEFINAMRETIPRSNRMKNAFTHLRIASGEYNSILKNHDITIEELNSLITDANYQRNFMGGRSKKAAIAGLRKTRKPSRRF
jgi:hypothetical protein